MTPLDAEFYVATYPDVAAAGLTAAAHWRDWGQAEERLPCPEERIVAASGLFDENYYAMNNEDVRRAGLAPLAHYCQHGIGERRRPNPYFDPKFYEAAHGAPRHMGALSHYALFGEARHWRPSLLFDPAYYLAAHALPAGGGLAHFLAHRRTGEVSPLPFFDVLFYRESCGRALRPGRDPFIHYLDAAATRDIAPAPWFDPAAYRASRMPAGSREPALLHLLRTAVVGRA